MLAAPEKLIDIEGLNVDHGNVFLSTKNNLQATVMQAGTTGYQRKSEGRELLQDEEGDREEGRPMEKLVVVGVKPGFQKLWFNHLNLEVGDRKTETMERMDCRMIQEVCSYSHSLICWFPFLVWVPLPTAPPPAAKAAG
ncbi:hypothetical protein L1887_09035 [Cichorium endivia]|nr:hypothetical protein L1887_09035 [Cichorium endivia]